jgi:hypothetical protein
MRLGQPKQRSRAGVRAALGDLGAAKPSTSSVIKRCSFPEALDGCAGLDVLEPHSAHNAGVFFLPQRVPQYFEALTATRHTERDILLAPTNIRSVYTGVTDESRFLASK